MIKDSKSCYAMIIAAHPDDADLGIGGTAYTWTEKGKKVIYVICTNGDKGTDDPDITPQQLAKIRQKEQKQAAKLLGIHKVIFLPHEDQTLEDTSEFRKEIVLLIRKYKPTVVATSDPIQINHWHRDHRITGQVVLDAIYPFARNRPAYPDLLQQGLEPHIVKEILLWGSEQHNYAIDITDAFKMKMAAVKSHKSQFGKITPQMENFFIKRFATKLPDKKLKFEEKFRRIVIER